MHLTFRLVGLLSLPPLLWASNAVVGRMVVPLVPPLALNALRWICTFLLLCGLGWRVLATPSSRFAVRQRWRYLSLLGLFGFGAYNALQYLALTTSNPINVTLIASSVPAFMLLVGAVFFGAKPSRGQLLAVLFCGAGVLCVICRGDWNQLAGVHFVPGDLLMLAAAFCWACYSWLLAQPPAHMRGVEAPTLLQDGHPRPWNWAEFLMVQSLFGLIFALPAAVTEHQLYARTIEWQPWVLLAVVYIAAGPSVLAYGVWGKAVKLGGPQLAAIFTNLTPVFAALLSTLLLGETPQWYHAAALLLILTGIWMSSWR